MFLECSIYISKSSSCRKNYTMNELISVETCSDLSTEFRLNEIFKIEDYFES